jgi:hypothetical protein
MMKPCQNNGKLVPLGKRLPCHEIFISCQEVRPRSANGLEINGSKIQLQERSPSPHSHDKRTGSTGTHKLPKITLQKVKTEVNDSECEITKRPDRTEVNDSKCEITRQPDKLPEITKQPDKTEVNELGCGTQLPLDTDTSDLPPIQNVTPEHEITLRPDSPKRAALFGGFPGRPPKMPFDFTNLLEADSPNSLSERRSLTLSECSSLAFSSSSTETVSPRP